VHQYREGKVKSTATSGVKEFLKPDAYKQWEPGLQLRLGFAGDRVPFA
jgi:hypothetical protein